MTQLCQSADWQSPACRWVGGKPGSSQERNRFYKYLRFQLGDGSVEPQIADYFEKREANFLAYREAVKKRMSQPAWRQSAAELLSEQNR